MCTGSSPLRVYQARIVAMDGSPVAVQVFQVRGLATVELGGPTYHLDCNTSRNDGSGIVWTRVGSHNHFSVSDAPAGGRRLSLGGLSESDLGVYECSDTLMGDKVAINITTSELLSHLSSEASVAQPYQVHPQVQLENNYYPFTGIHKYTQGQPDHPTNLNYVFQTQSLFAHVSSYTCVMPWASP